MAYTPSRYVKSKILKMFENHHYFNVQPDPRFLEAIDRGRERFNARNRSEFHRFFPKDISRYMLVKEHFPQVLKGSVADIGSREFEKISSALGVSVTGIDKNNTTLASFDWDKEPLPFSNKQFDTVLCLDTLEHITDFHTAFADLLRIAKSNVVISLPNCWRRTPKDILTASSTRESYGLPVEKPFDRHRWYMSTEDIEDFMFYNAKKNGFVVSGLIYHTPTPLWRHWLLALSRFISNRYYKNLVVTTLFIVLSRDALNREEQNVV